MSRIEEAKEAAATAIFLQRPLGVFRITGETRLDLIDRMSTQQVKNLKAGEGAATVLTTEIGRIIDRLLLYADEKEVLAITGENNADNIIRYLMRFVFFNDDFHMEDLSASTAVFAVYGAAPEDKLRELGLIDAELPLHHWQNATLGDISVSVHRTDPISGDGYLIIAADDQAEEIAEELAQASITRIDQEAFHRLRVEAGLPLLGREMTADYIPLETDLWADVSFNKGCYIGQEIIARMESRGKLAKKLVKLEAAAPLAEANEIMADGKRVGTITSAAGNRALGYVKTAALESEATLSADGVSLSVKSL